MPSIKFLFACIFSLALFAGNAQTTKPKPKPKPAITTIAKFKPPVVKTFLGVNEDGALVTANEAAQLVNLPLKVTDAKNVSYTVASYQFMYKKKSVIENEETGKKEIVFTTVADQFKATPLPEIWRTNVGGGLQKDEELFFFDIVVTDKLNRRFFAPNIKIRIK